MQFVWYWLSNPFVYGFFPIDCTTKNILLSIPYTLNYILTFSIVTHIENRLYIKCCAIFISYKKDCDNRIFKIIQYYVKCNMRGQSIFCNIIIKSKMATLPVAIYI